MQGDRSELLSRATAALSTYTHVLLYEHIEDIPSYLSCAYGCTNVTGATQYYNPRNHNVPVPPEWPEYFRVQNYMDAQLYDAAKNLYYKQTCVGGPHNGVEK